MPKCSSRPGDLEVAACKAALSYLSIQSELSRCPGNGPAILGKFLRKGLPMLTSALAALSDAQSGVEAYLEKSRNTTAVYMEPARLFNWKRQFAFSTLAEYTRCALQEVMHIADLSVTGQEAQALSRLRHFSTEFPDPLCPALDRSLSEEWRAFDARLEEEYRFAETALAETKTGALQVTQKAAETVPRYQFRDKGAFYEVRFEGECGSIPRLLGANCVYHLLQKPFQVFTPSSLHALAQGRPEIHQAAISDAEEERRELGRDLKELLRERQNAKDRNDPAAEERLDVQIEDVSREFQRLTGLGGKARRADDPKRRTVGKAIDALRVNCREKWKMPRLADHLDLIEMRGGPSYRPKMPAPVWEF